MCIHIKTHTKHYTGWCSKISSSSSSTIRIVKFWLYTNTLTHTHTYICLYIIPIHGYGHVHRHVLVWTFLTEIYRHILKIFVNTIHTIHGPHITQYNLLHAQILALMSIYRCVYAETNTLICIIYNTQNFGLNVAKKKDFIDLIQQTCSPKTFYVRIHK